MLSILLFVVAIGLGCRSPFAPNVDRNRAPETWIVAAPQDTITLRNPDGTIQFPQIGTIPVRYHLYWAGSDQDGAVTGFYYAVVETLPVPPEGLPTVPPLPGPKPGDYRYTAKSDSTFIFNVSEFAPDRQHAFYVYSVDDKGKGDPTPARFIFNALDRFPPIIYMPREWASGTGPIARLLQSGSVLVKDTTCFISDTSDVPASGRAPRDTVPSKARLDFRWRGIPSVEGTFVAGYKYKLDEPAFVEVGPGDTTVSYNTGIGGDVIVPGTKQFTLRAIDQAGGARTTTRRFEMNYQPDTWFSGPDLSLYPPGQRKFRVSGPVSAFPGSLLSCDSLTVLPSARPHHRSFFEIYKDTIYVRGENETVHMNALLLMHAGGNDLDSPYLVQVSPNNPGIDTTACAGQPGGAVVLHAAGLIGQPIGFRSQIGTKLDPLRITLSDPSPSTLFPVADISSNFHNPKIAAYINPRLSGRAYIVIRAQDGDGKLDRRISSSRSAVKLADDVDAGIETNPDLVALRTRIMTVNVNYNPFLDFSNPLFFPKRPQDQGGVVSTSPERKLTLSLFANDPDPLDLSGVTPEPGSPSATVVLRYKVTVHGANAQGRDTTYTTPQIPGSTAATIVIDLPADAPYIVGTNLMLDVELCDCANCETSPGSGKCVYYSIPVNVPPPAPAAVTSSAVPAASSGSGGARPADRSETP